jgi:imidazoleglycerol phosphate synthase glutamine amidotransferase subunit HisH
MVLLHHHLEAVAQIGLEAQKMVVVEMEEDEKPFPHMGSPS